MSVTQIMETFSTVVNSMQFEFSFLVCFCMGFIFLRLDKYPSGTKKSAGKQKSENFKESYLVNVAKGEEEFDASRVLCAWRACRSEAPSPAEVLELVVKAFLAIEPDKLTDEVIQHFRGHRAELVHSRHVTVVLDVVARAGNIEVMEALAKIFVEEMRLPMHMRIYEVLLGAYATAGDEAKVVDLVSEIRSRSINLSSRAHCLMIKGFLKNGLVSGAMREICEMNKANFEVPSFAVMQLHRIAGDANRAGETFRTLHEGSGVPLNAEASVIILENCQKRNNVTLAKLVEAAARKGGVPLPISAYDALLKLLAGSADPYAIDLFRELQEITSLRISEGLCVAIIARCAESRFLRLAEAVVKYVRSRLSISIAVYSALMKVYAFCNMYDKACDLYDDILKDGLEPDALMYGCLMKFAVECGRTDLSRQLSEKTPCLESQQYMSLIRAAGRDKDVDTACAILDRMKVSGFTIDGAASNCVLDVCVGAGDIVRAQKMHADMCARGVVDIISHNTLLKGLCQAGDVRAVKKLLNTMSKMGVEPNDVSYNCMINAAVSARPPNFKEAWTTLDQMEQKGYVPDGYTLSILMKALKRGGDHQDVARAFDLFDRSKVDVCSDEVLLVTVLEAGIRAHEVKRLESVLNTFHKSTLRASVHTYGALIKASGLLRRTARCWDLWHEMEHRGTEPNQIVVGCMLDALVNNNEVEKAVSLLEEIKGRVQPNAIMYTTLIKGFASTQQSDRAIEMWRRMRKEGMPMNQVSYNSVIDTQARVGAMDEAHEVIEAMKADRVEPDAITFSTTVKGYCVQGNLDKAFEVFRGMQKAGLVRDSVVFNTLLDGCVRHAKWDLADGLMEELEKSDFVAPSSFTLGILVKMYGRRKQLDKAFHVVAEMPRRFNFRVNNQVLSCLMCSCLGNHAPDRALEVFKQMQAKDSKTYGILISGLTRFGKYEDCVTLVDEAYGLTGPRKMPAGQNLDSESMDKLFLALSRSGNMEQSAIALAHKLRAAGAPISRRMCASVLSGGHGGRQQARW